MEKSIIVTPSTPQDVNNPITKDDILKKIEFLSQRLISRRSIQKAIQFGELMYNLKPLFKDKKIYMAKLKEVTNWTVKYINFILDLYHFVKNYPRLLYSTFSVYKIKQNFKSIKQLFSSMEIHDKAIWKTNTGNYVI